MLTVQEMAPAIRSGLPRNGLVGLWDPYRDTYGRNVSALSLDLMYKYMLGLSDGVFYETTDETTHVAKPVQATTIGLTYSAEFRFTPVGGRKRFMFNVGGASAVFDVTTCALVGSSGFTGAPVIDSLGGGQFAVRGVATASGTGGVYLAPMPDNATSYADRNFAGDTSKGFTLNQWQVNLGSTLFPYSTPAGEPGTLQTSLDYSGNGNHLTLGATTGASTDDPSNTGTAWSFDGGDFLTAGRPAQLEIAQPWWGFGVYYLTANGATECLVSKNNSSGSSGAGKTGFYVNKTSSNRTQMNIFDSSGNSYYVQSPVFATGWHWVSYGWNGTQITANIDRVDGTPTNMATFWPDTSNNLTFGKYAYINATYYTGSLSLAGVYSRYPALSERMRMALCVKGLMASRGVTLA